MSFRIIGTGSALPACRITNDDLSRLVDTNDEWITTRTGIRERPILTTESVTEIAVAAARNALENSGISPADLDYIICPTLGGDYMTPSLACVVQMELQANCPAVDVNGACSGFLYALDVADGVFARGKARYVLVLAAERLSRILDWSDRSTCVLFGDAAAAVVLEAGDALHYLEVTARGNLCLASPFAPGSCPYTEPDTRKPGLLMKNREVYTFAVSTICSSLKRRRRRRAFPWRKRIISSFIRRISASLRRRAKNWACRRRNSPSTFRNTEIRPPQAFRFCSMSGTEREN